MPPQLPGLLLIHSMPFVKVPKEGELIVNGAPVIVPKPISIQAAARHVGNATDVVHHRILDVKRDSGIGSVGLELIRRG